MTIQITQLNTLSTKCYINQPYKKKTILLHHTASDSNCPAIVRYWNSQGDGVSVPFVISGGSGKDGNITWKDGQIWQLFNSNLCCYHLGITSQILTSIAPKTHSTNVVLNFQAVGIELTCMGYAELKNDKFVAYDGSIIPENEIYDFGDKPYRNYRYYQKYSAAQIDSLYELMKLLGTKYEIDLKYNPDIWDTTERALSGSPGVFSHVSYRPNGTGKWDTYPFPPLIQMLQSL